MICRQEQTGASVMIRNTMQPEIHTSSTAEESWVFFFTITRTINVQYKAE